MIVVALKWVGGDPRWATVSDSDRAALEVGLHLAEAADDTVTAVTVGRADADGGLREALAVGAARAVRVDGPANLVSAEVAAAVATVAAGARWVVCGDASADRGSGSVPAFVAAELAAAQALGLVEVSLVGDGVRAVRRLDGGRRELLGLQPPAVLSVEGSVARLRRAALGAEVIARTTPIEVVAGPSGPVEEPRSIVPYRPRPRVMPMPQGDALDRVRALTTHGANAPSGHGEIVTLDPPAAAARILAALREWGDIPD